MWKELLRELWADEAAEAIGDFAVLAVIAALGVISAVAAIAETSFDFWSFVVRTR